MWRAERGRAYLEAGIGAYFLSHTINNDKVRLPSSFQFGSHVGAGLRLGPGGKATIGIAFQHLSNAGIKQPNGGIDFVMIYLGTAGASGCAGNCLVAGSR